MKDVTAAIIEYDGRILIAQRSRDDSLALMWEFPGGKLEKDEGPEECLQREILEELNLQVSINEHFGDSVYNYGNKEINLMAYKCSLVSGEVKLNVHDDVQWVTAPELLKYSFAPADRPIVLRLLKEHIQKLSIRLETLTVYRPILDNSLLSQYYWLLKIIESEALSITDFLSAYGQLCHDLMNWQGCANYGNFSLADYILEQIIYQENPLSRAAEKAGAAKLPLFLREAARNDLDTLYDASVLPCSFIKEIARMSFELQNQKGTSIFVLPEWSCTNGNGNGPVFKDEISWGERLDELVAFHHKSGSGIFARFKGFIWERGGQEGIIRGVQTPDEVSLDDFIGYEAQRNQLIENTEQLLRGSRANNVLLYGARGTGKSSTVKALLNEYSGRGLRIVEIPKNYLTDFPYIIRQLRERPQKFILFIDDLAFEDSEENYTALKAVLEGGLETRPDNMVIYATSNRRHIVKERFSERAGMLDDNDEVHAADSMQEKLSLADRFGMTITFPSPGQEEYLRIVQELAKKAGIEMPEEELRREAVRWEMRYNGRSPRTARQFMTWLEGNKG